MLTNAFGAYLMPTVAVKHSIKKTKELVGLTLIGIKPYPTIFQMMAFTQNTIPFLTFFINKL